MIAPQVRERRARARRQMTFRAMHGNMFRRERARRSRHRRARVHWSRTNRNRRRCARLDCGRYGFLKCRTHACCQRRPGSVSNLHTFAILSPHPSRSVFSKCTRRITWAPAASRMRSLVRCASAMPCRFTASDCRSARRSRLIASFSEHLAWSSHDGVYFNDLLPLPYTPQTLARVAEHIDTVQAVLCRPILLENPSSYLSLAESTISEADFLAEVSRRTGCGLLLDVNNVFVSCTNLGGRPYDYLDAFPLDRVREIHLGGHHQDADEAGAPLLIDAHGSPVADPVWALFTGVLARTGPLPTLIEWDNDLPSWAVLRAQAEVAAQLLTNARARMPNASAA